MKVTRKNEVGEMWMSGEWKVVARGPSGNTECCVMVEYDSY